MHVWGIWMFRCICARSLVSRPTHALSQFINVARRPAYSACNIDKLGERACMGTRLTFVWTAVYNACSSVGNNNRLAVLIINFSRVYNSVCCLLSAVIGSNIRCKVTVAKTLDNKSKSQPLEHIKEKMVHGGWKGESWSCMKFQHFKILGKSVLKTCLYGSGEV